MKVGAFAHRKNAVAAACGRVRSGIKNDFGEMILKPLRALVFPVLFSLASLASAATIDRINTATFGHYDQEYLSSGAFLVFSTADEYVLSDGSSWDSGAGSSTPAYAKLKSVSTSGSSITYSFNATTSGVLYRQTDYDSGDHSAQGTLSLPASLSIVAEAGSRTGVMRGYTQILSNEETWYGQPRFNYYSAPVGASVYFEQTFRLIDTTFTADLFSRNFTYNEFGFVDFTKVAPVPEPSTGLLLLVGGTAVLSLQARRRRRAA